MADQSLGVVLNRTVIRDLLEVMIDSLKAVFLTILFIGGGIHLALCEPMSSGSEESLHTLSPGKQLITLLYYFEIGQQAVSKYLQGIPAEGNQNFAAVLLPLEKDAVRVWVIYNKTPQSFQTDHGSGVFLGDGRHVITAGHELDVLDRFPDAEIKLILADGRTVSAKVIARRKARERTPNTDWALLEVVNGTDLPTGIPVGSLKDKSIVIAMGYPDGLGINPEGEIAIDNDSKPEPLLPLMVACRSEQATDTSLTPIAGCIPLGGISGGAVIDTEGKLVGIQVAVSTHRKEANLSWTIDISSFQEAL